MAVPSVSGCCLSLTASVSRTSAGTLRPSGSECRVWIPDGTVRPSRSRTPHSGRMPTANSVPTTRPTPGLLTTRRLAARNLMAAAERRGTEVQLREQVVAILQKNGRVQGIRLRSGSVIQSPVVVNVAGPYSGQVNALAGVTGEFRIRTRPLRQEVHSVPAPAGYARGELGPAVTDGDLGTYFRSHFGGQLIVGSAEPECDALHWIDDPDAFEAEPTAQAWDSQVLRLARRIPSLGIPPRPVGYACTI